MIRPELSSNGRMIWFRPARSRSDNWTVFEPETGMAQQVTDRRMFEMREKDPHSMPLWVTIPK